MNIRTVTGHAGIRPAALRLRRVCVSGPAPQIPSSSPSHLTVFHLSWCRQAWGTRQYSRGVPSFVSCHTCHRMKGRLSASCIHLNRKSSVLIQGAVRRAAAAIETWPRGHHFCAARPAASVADKAGVKRPLTARSSPVSRAQTAGRGPRHPADHADPARARSVPATGATRGGVGAFWGRFADVAAATAYGATKRPRLVWLLAGRPLMARVASPTRRRCQAASVPPRSRIGR